MISRKLKVAIKLNGMPAYRIAQAAGVHPNTLSKLLNGIEKVKSNDPRIIAVGRVLGLPADQCFEPEVTNGNA
jgi:hypothetical protein